MKKKNYWLLTSAVTLLPIAVGLLLWDLLPERLPTHFGPDGTADGWGSKAFAVFGLPTMFLIFNWIIYAVSRLDKQNHGHNEKVLDLIGLIFPTMSVIFAMVMYSAGLGLELNMTRILLPLLGVFFVLVGNWMPKIRQNSTLGIKLPWTLYNEENWNKTHRIGGYTWVFGGLGMIVLGFLPEGDLFGWLLLTLMLIMILVPTVYSWNLARNQKNVGTYTESRVNQRMKQNPVLRAVSLVAVAAILIGATVVMFTGEIECSCTENTLTIEADYWEDLTVQLDSIDSVEYRPEGVSGTREWGWGSARLLLGFFRSDELGGYTRYTYTGDRGCILIRSGEELLVVALKEEAQTLALYEQLVDAVG